jgi:hypothetical protein
MGRQRQLAILVSCRWTGAPHEQGSGTALNAGSAASKVQPSHAVAANERQVQVAAVIHPPAATGRLAATRMSGCHLGIANGVGPISWPSPTL